MQLQDPTSSVSAIMQITHLKASEPQTSFIAGGLLGRLLHPSLLLIRSLRSIQFRPEFDIQDTGTCVQL
jgi:hypothetical protein